jgi:uncharacterized protein (TIGR00299 family) protein
MIGWLDAASGASGDMLLAALVDAGADESFIGSAIEAVAPEDVGLSTEHVTRASLAARRAVVDVADSSTHRGLRDVLALLSASGCDLAVGEHAAAVFTRLAEAEASVHGTSVDQVHFHEVGALDAIADIVGACAGFVNLGLEALHCSPVAVGSGTVSTAHGTVSVPPPAVAALLRGLPTYAGPVAHELCTPTGAALLAHWVTHWGPQPPMVVTTVGVGAGQRDFPSHPNVLRLFVGEQRSMRENVHEGLVIETNIDDLDPRLWPRILSALLDRGASDAWLTPILMKKGRPAHTLSVLVRPAVAGDVRAAIYAETSAIGSREYAVAKDELDRTFQQVTVDGQDIVVKVASSAGIIVNVQPEYDDVVAAAEALGRPAKTVLAAAVARAAELSHRRP